MKISYNIDLPNGRKEGRYASEYRAIDQVHEGKYATAGMEYDPGTDLERVRRALRAHLLNKGIKDVGVTVVTSKRLVIAYKKEVK